MVRDEKWRLMESDKAAKDIRRQNENTMYIPKTLTELTNGDNAKNFRTGNCKLKKSTSTYLVLGQVVIAITIINHQT